MEIERIRKGKSRKNTVMQMPKDTSVRVVSICARKEPAGKHDISLACKRKNSRILRILCKTDPHLKREPDLRRNFRDLCQNAEVDRRALVRAKPLDEEGISRDLLDAETFIESPNGVQILTK